MRNVVLAMLLPVTVLASTASADSLGPARPSDLVTLTTSGAVCPDVAVARTFDQRVNSDGTVTPFTIPDKSVLVVTGIDWRQGNAGCATCSDELFVYTSPVAFGGLRVDSFGQGSASGRAGGNVAVTGVVVKPGIALCFQVNSGNIGSADAVVHGFLAKDQ